ncbi:MAG: hypothetical protein PHY48_09030 [Candidatus Cloacimonetes bacterium]|jgi:hypothetical protein|nr:hypothetical protein [Candidatus Cloacimonadota bacterium]
MKNFEKILSRYTGEDQKVLFYPSCGNYNILPEIFQLDYDLFVLCDFGKKDGDWAFADFFKGHPEMQDDYKALLRHYKAPSETERFRFWDHFRSQLPPATYKYNDNGYPKIKYADQHLIFFQINNKHVALFLWDNNITLAMLQTLGVKISCLVTVNCGCEEGHAYFCNNNQKWLRRVFSNMHHSGIMHITDHFNNSSNRYTLNAPEWLLSEFSATRIDQKEWAAENKITRSPFPTLFTKDDELFIFKIESHKQPVISS